MAGVTVLRDEARAAILSAGGRGFVRFAAEGDALLLSDANRRGDAKTLVRALEDAGFGCEIWDGLLYITPGDAQLMRLCATQPQEMTVDWESPLFEAMALVAHLLREDQMPLDEGGRGLVMKTARLLWQMESKVLAGLPDLRAMIAVRLREGKRSGLHEAGRLLCGWIRENGRCKEESR